MSLIAVSSFLWLIDVESGKILKQIRLPERSVTTPAFIEDKIYFAGKKKYFFIYDFEKHRLKKRKLKNGTICSPAVFEDRIFLVDNKGYLCAFNKRGKLERSIPTGGKPGLSVLIFKNHAWWCGFDGKFRKSPLTPSLAMGTLLSFQALYAPPLLWKNRGLFFVTTRDGFLKVVSERLVIKKIFRLPCQIYSSPVFLNGFVYCIDSSGMLLCIELASWKVLWRKRLLSTLATPVLWGRRLVVVCDGKIFVLNQNGETERQFDFPFHPTSSCPVVLNGKLFIATREGKLVCFDVKAGNIRWQIETGEILADLVIFDGKGLIKGRRNVFEYSPVLKPLKKFKKPSTVVIASDWEGIYGIGKDGGVNYLRNSTVVSTVQPFWLGSLAVFCYQTGNISIVGKSGKVLRNVSFSPDKILAASPAGSKILILTASEKGKKSFILLNKKLEILGKISTEFSSRVPPLVYRKKIYVHTDSGLVVCLDRTGKKLWSFQAAPPYRQGPLMGKRLVLVFCKNGEVFFLDPLTGELKFKRKFEGELKSCAFKNGKTIGICTTSALVPDVFKEKSFKTPGLVQSTPAVVDGKIWVLDVRGNLWEFSDRGWKRLARLDSPAYQDMKVSPEGIFTVSGNFLYFLSRKGQILWKFYLSGRGPFLFLPVGEF